MDTIEHSAGVILFHFDGSENPLVLLVQHTDGHWGMPKGHVESNESLLQTAVRELREETGVDKIEMISGITLTESYSYEREGIQYDKQVVYFVAVANTRSLPERENVFKQEIPDVLWVPFQEALIILSHEESREVLRQAQQYAVDQLQK
ncbi:MAG: hydrolase [Candidatus Kaiserbacteria bacterium]|nr:hydrolase [Candidatus Kaiserbacteria bacterium]